MKTPNVDAFWKQSVRLTDFHVSPTCAPTRSSLMTGRHEFRNGVTHTILERERMTLKATTIAQVLKGAGYATGVFGKWHLGLTEPYWPDKQGFDLAFHAKPVVAAQVPARIDHGDLTSLLYLQGYRLTDFVERKDP